MKLTRERRRALQLPDISTIGEIPSEFMDVNYGQAVKRYLLDCVTLLHIHRFDPNDVQFADALVSSAVVWFRKSPPPKSHAVTFTFGGTLLEPKVSRTVSARALAQETKWTRFPAADIRSRSGISDYLRFLSDQTRPGDGPQRIFHPPGRGD